MPSVLVGGLATSGVTLVLSGSVSSGRIMNRAWPNTGIQFRFDPIAGSGAVCFVGLSGGMTVNSGALGQGGSLSGGCLSGMLDAMPLGAGDSYFVPRDAIPISGIFNVFAFPNGAASGQRLYFEVF